ncbi:class F sortase [Pseudarthrobacter sp. NBSH8]|uniref:class F sortase n=1 Tax=Pseudarthrobacter sp. NBSH8 TaxID=2596911 RepID=UPI001626C77E|nr:class F sortase [Pseudarthrobacter sp. NBSH8]QNE16198.1 class F sortase [Pseudarthrobacter sp. NBSH8]
MAKLSGRHEVPKRLRGWNRGDIAILACGVLGFLSFTFGGPLLDQQGAATPGTSPAAYSSGTSSIQLPLPLAAPDLPAAPAASVPAAVAPVANGPVLPKASAPQRIVYPKAAMDTAVHPLAPDSTAIESQTIVPPTTMDGYWLTPFGTPGNGSGNTTYIIGHSWEGRDAPFNHLSSAAVVGDTFEVVTATGTIPYRVDSVTTYLKDSLKDSPIWDMVPSRVVLISCYTEDPWGKNVVVTASPAAS